MKGAVIRNSFDESVRLSEKKESITEKLLSLEQNTLFRLKEVRKLEGLSFPDFDRGINLQE